MFFSINAIDHFVDMSVQDNKYMDPFDRHIGIRIEKKDKVDKPLENYSSSRLDKAFEKENPEEFLNLLELVLENPPSSFTTPLVEPKLLENKASHIKDAYLEETGSIPIFLPALLTNEQIKNHVNHGCNI